MNINGLCYVTAMDYTFNCQFSPNTDLFHGNIIESERQDESSCFNSYVIHCVVGACVYIVEALTMYCSLPNLPVYKLGLSPADVPRDCFRLILEAESLQFYCNTELTSNTLRFGSNVQHTTRQWASHPIPSN